MNTWNNSASFLIPYWERMLNHGKFPFQQMICDLIKFLDFGEKYRPSVLEIAPLPTQIGEALDTMKINCDYHRVENPASIHQIHGHRHWDFLVSGPIGPCRLRPSFGRSSVEEISCDNSDIRSFSETMRCFSNKADAILIHKGWTPEHREIRLNGPGNPHFSCVREAQNSHSSKPGSARFSDWSLQFKKGGQMEQFRIREFLFEKKKVFEEARLQQYYETDHFVLVGKKDGKKN